MPPNTGGGGGALSLKNLKQTSSDTPPNCIPISKTPTKKARPVPAKIQRPRGNDANTSLLSTSFSSFLEKWPILTCDYYQIDALHLASRLLGKHLRRDDVLQITEVEAYRPNDSACHGRFGITPRTALVFGPGGNAYVNIVADKDGVGAAAVLVRSCAPVYDFERLLPKVHAGNVCCYLEWGWKPFKSVGAWSQRNQFFLQGPEKFGQALGISTEWSNHSLFTPGDLEVLEGPEPEKIVVGPRVGIDYAQPEWCWCSRNNEQSILSTFQDV